MKIGYACLTVGVSDTDLKSCIMKNASEEKLKEIIAHNLKSLEHIIDYNIKNQIKLFRISSDLIPFGSSPVNQLAWWEIFAPQFAEIGAKIQKSGMRVSMHPGQYTVLNSPNADVVNRAIEDLTYHTRVLDALDVGQAHKIILHVGGIYGDKKQAMERFMINYARLNDGIKKRLVIENDDKLYTVEDILSIGNKLNIPVVFDNLHHKINPCGGDDVLWLKECAKTWKKADGNQKIHYSQQDKLKKPGAHSETIMAEEFMAFYHVVQNKDIDIMLEVKDKNLSAMKCMNLITENKKIKALEAEWGKYKYAVLEHSPADYLAIRGLLKDKKAYPALAFYQLIEHAMQEEVTAGNAINAAQHVWGYFKEKALVKEKAKFLKSMEAFEQGDFSINRIKKFLWQMAVQYEELYLLESYYFII